MVEQTRTPGRRAEHVVSGQATDQKDAEIDCRPAGLGASGKS